MANLTVENLSRVVQGGDTEQLFSGVHGPGRTMREPKDSKPGEVDPSFSEILKESVEKVNAYQSQANTAIHELVAGRSKNIHETLLTVERADTSLKLMMQVRNKILDAYKEIMRMQV